MKTNKGPYEPCWTPMKFDKNGDLVPDVEPTERPEVRDTRDLRDPQLLGEALLAHKQDLLESARRDGATGFIVARMTDVYKDAMRRNLVVPDYAHGESIAQQAAREYREELEARTDKYAKSALESIDAGRGVEGYDEAGA